jgi:hypothetical protein
MMTDPGVAVSASFFQEEFRFDPKQTWCDYRQNSLGGTAHKNTSRLVPPI